ncbi:hypothetical protein E3N88_00241 [Mikania micrantha]|uniref:Tf2-1-like SH3-like domain-containing protein n=1 Tax=Mikania micrantha TaxID=192012 RepID=A0A5N6PXH1_9ASTR|nr:hypothetical protein E3N88_00241 [Mikania micrantha]
MLKFAYLRGHRRHSPKAVPCKMSMHSARIAVVVVLRGSRGARFLFLFPSGNKPTLLDPVSVSSTIQTVSTRFLLTIVKTTSGTFRECTNILTGSRERCSGCLLVSPSSGSFFSAESSGKEDSSNPEPYGSSPGRQKSYADKRRKPLEFQVGDRVLLKVSSWKGVIRFGKRGKLSPRYVEPFEILKRIGPVAYQLQLPNELRGVHDVFHVSNLKKCLSNETLIVPLEEIQVDEQLRFIEEPAEIMDREVKQLKQSKIPIVKVRWNSRRGPEFTWEREDQMMKKYPHLFKTTTANNMNTR